MAQRAFVTTREIWRTERQGAKKVRIRTGVETVRRSVCPQFGHHAPVEFVGVVEAGWLFLCRQSAGPGSRGHHFVAAPPDEQG